jgi:hypothetical protein
MTRRQYLCVKSGVVGLLQDHIGAVFVETAFLRGDPLDYDGFGADIYVDEIAVGRGVSDRLRELNQL